MLIRLKDIMLFLLFLFLAIFSSQEDRAGKPNLLIPNIVEPVEIKTRVTCPRLR